MQGLSGRGSFVFRLNTASVSGADDESSTADGLVFEELKGVCRCVTNIDDAMIGR